MKFLKYPFHILHRTWFYIMVTLSLLILAPFFLVTLAKESWYPAFFWLARKWGTFVLFSCGFLPLMKDGFFHEKGKSFVFVANHTSMLDIMLMLYTVKNPFVFVGKKELAKMPIFGFFYKRSCILVDRGDADSRKAVFAAAQARINQGLSICIFPEGGITYKGTLLDPFKTGAFRLAINHQLPIVPLVFPDNKKRFEWKFFSGSLGKTRSYILKTFEVNQLELKDKNKLKENVRQLIYDKLVAEGAE